MANPFQSETWKQIEDMQDRIVAYREFAAELVLNREYGLSHQILLLRNDYKLRWTAQVRNFLQFNPGLEVYDFAKDPDLMHLSVIDLDRVKGIKADLRRRWLPDASD